MCHERILCAAAHRQSDGHFYRPEMSPTTQRTPDPTRPRQTTVCFSYSSWNEFSSATIATEGRGCRTSGSGVATWGGSVRQATKPTIAQPRSPWPCRPRKINGAGAHVLPVPVWNDSRRRLRCPFRSSDRSAKQRFGVGRPPCVTPWRRFFRMGTGKALPGERGQGSGVAGGPEGRRVPGMAELPSSFAEQI